MTQSTGASTTDQARERAQEAGAQAKEKAQEAGAQARGQVSQQVDQRSTQVGEQATSAAEAMRQASQQLREKGNEPVANVMETVSQRVEGAGSWLRDADGDRILNDVEDFARGNPLAVVAGGVALGFALSRVLKASSQSRYESLRSSGPRYGSSSYGSSGTALPPAGGTSSGRVGTGAGAREPGYATRTGDVSTPPTGGSLTGDPDLPPGRGSGFAGGVGGEGEGARPVR